jgi:FKBP-type peptidyl-prolyl cis-trans isomerase (trigger factor)
MTVSADPAGPLFLPLTAAGPHRRYLVVVPAAAILAERDRRLAGLDLPSSPEDSPVRQRLAESMLAESIEQAAAAAIAGLVRAERLAAAGPARLDTVAAPPSDDLILRAAIPTFPAVEPPDLAGLRIERLLARPDPAETDRALAALAARHAAWRERPPGTAAEPGDQVIADVTCTLLPARNHLPQPGVAGAAPGSPPRLPDGWTFGDNGAGLKAELLAVSADTDPPHIRLRVSGTAPRDGQSFVIFHLPRAIRAAPDTAWVGSVAIRPVGAPAGLRGCKLRLQSQAESGEGSLRRKDAALVHPGGGGFERCYVSESFPEPATAFLRMPLLFDHAAGPVDFCCDIGAPRLVEGLDLGEQPPVPLPAFSGEALALGAGAPDPAGLAPRLAGLVAGDSTDIVLRLPDTLPDRALAAREARFAIRVRSVRERVVTAADDALARGLGFADLRALRSAVETRLAARDAALQRGQLREAALDALVRAAGEIPLPAEALEAQTTAIWPQLAAQAARRGETLTPMAAAAAAARRLRIGLLVAAVADRHGLAPDEAARRAAAQALGRNAPAGDIEARALEDAVVAHVLAQAVVGDRVVSSAELAAAQG